MTLLPAPHSPFTSFPAPSRLSRRPYRSSRPNTDTTGTDPDGTRSLPAVFKSDRKFSRLKTTQVSRSPTSPTPTGHRDCNPRKRGATSLPTTRSDMPSQPTAPRSETLVRKRTATQNAEIKKERPTIGHSFLGMKYRNPYASFSAGASAASAFLAAGFLAAAFLAGAAVSPATSTAAPSAAGASAFLARLRRVLGFSAAFTSFV